MYKEVDTDNIAGYVWREDHDEHLRSLLKEVEDGENFTALAAQDLGSKWEFKERDKYELMTDCVEGKRHETIYRPDNVRQALTNAFNLGFSRGYKYGHGVGSGKIKTITDPDFIESEARIKLVNLINGIDNKEILRTILLYLVEE